MSKFQVLICGGGISVYSLAFWLSKLNHEVTVIERWSGLRENGLQLDLRGFGVDVLRYASLEEAFRATSVDEKGIEVVDKHGKVWGFFPPEDSSKGVGTFTSEYEIMRGDFVRLLYEASKDRVNSVFGTSVSRLQQHDRFVEVTFANGSQGKFDLVVGADGQNSRMRGMMLGDEILDPVQWLGQAVAYFTTPRDIQPSTDYRAKAYLATGSRFIMTRRSNEHSVQAYLICNSSGNFLKDVRKGDVDSEKRAFADKFSAAGWRAEEILRAMEESEDFYCEHPGVVQCAPWSNGRIVLVGDAAYGPTVNTGMGTTSSFVGAYILAGQISQHCEGSDGTTEDLGAALQSYENIFSPFMRHIQHGVVEGAGKGFPTSSLGIALTNLLIFVATWIGIDVFSYFRTGHFMKGWELPVYPKMIQDMNRD